MEQSNQGNELQTAGGYGQILWRYPPWAAGSPRAIRVVVGALDKPHLLENNLPLDLILSKTGVAQW